MRTEEELLRIKADLVQKLQVAEQQFAMLTKEIPTLQGAIMGINEALQPPGPVAINAAHLANFWVEIRRACRVMRKVAWQLRKQERQAVDITPVAKVTS